MSNTWAKSYYDLDKKLKVHPHNSMLSKWATSNIGWMELNFDGVVSLNDDYAVIGRVFCDLKGKWLWGYNMTFGMWICFQS